MLRKKVVSPGVSSLTANDFAPIFLLYKLNTCTESWFKESKTYFISKHQEFPLTWSGRYIISGTLCKIFTPNLPAQPLTLWDPACLWKTKILDSFLSNSSIGLLSLLNLYWQFFPPPVSIAARRVLSIQEILIKHALTDDWGMLSCIQNIMWV